MSQVLHPGSMGIGNNRIFPMMPSLFRSGPNWPNSPDLVSNEASVLKLGPSLVMKYLIQISNTTQIFYHINVNKLPPVFLAQPTRIVFLLIQTKMLCSFKEKFSTKCIVIYFVYMDLSLYEPVLGLHALKVIGWILIIYSKAILQVPCCRERLFLMNFTVCWSYFFLLPFLWRCILLLLKVWQDYKC